MKITRVTATAVKVPLKVDIIGLDRTQAMSACIVEVETDGGLVGHGFTSITDPEVIATAVNKVAGPKIIGDDPLLNERIWDKLYWEMMPRGQTGYAAHALAAIDIALWDIKGKALGQPIWKLIGGARPRVPIYVTFGFDFFAREQLPAAAKHWMDQGFRRLKMTVGHEALKRRSQKPLGQVILEDEQRVRVVREAMGANGNLYLDANCSLDFFHASQLAERVKQYNISFFEEPLTQNDVPLMAQLRRATGMALACGQNEGLAYRFRDMMVAGAIDVAQPNVVITGGFTQCIRIAGMAAAFNVSIANGGAWSFHNMHLHAGLANGGLVEHHYLGVELCKQLYTALPEPKDGVMDVPGTPGLGFELNRDAVKNYAMT